MEELLTSEFFNPGIFLSGLNPNDINDYIISSYTINMSYISSLFWHPKLRIYCDKRSSDIEYIPEEFKNHINFIDCGKGIYHTKFILITTSNTLRIVITTCNFTKMIFNCSNDYYRITTKLKNSNILNITENEILLQKYLNYYNIKLENNITKYDWSNISAKFLLNIPNSEYYHINLYRKYFNNIKFNKIQIQTSSVSFFGWNPLILFNTDYIEYIYLENYEDFKELNCFAYNNLLNNQNIKQIKKHLNIPFHYKRYILYGNNNKTYFILTSANFTKQAWLGINTELGIIIELKNSYN